MKTKEISTKNSKNLIGRRSFLKRSGAFLIISLIASSAARAVKGLFADEQKPRKPTPLKRSPQRLIYIAIDALHPKYFELNSLGLPGGRDGDWLMPHIREFLKKSVWYPNALAYLPAATDMNHLNALSGTNTGQTGIIGVWAQPVRWDSEGKPVIKYTNMSFARDDQGRQVDTLFHAWKRRWPDSKTLLITGKEWVGEMFKQEESKSGVDLIVTGMKYPQYLDPPQKENFADPQTDQDAACDPESGYLGFFDFKHLTRNNFFTHFSPSNTLTRLYTGQGGLLTKQMTHYPGHFPHDRWIADSTLTIFCKERPDMAYLLLAQCDDAGHCIGSGWDVSEFVAGDEPPELPAGCKMKQEYKLISKRNPLLFREAALDVIRDVDIQFGRLIKGLEELDVLNNTTIILLSDHSAINHISTEDFSSTDIMAILKQAGLVRDNQIYAFSVSSYGVLYWREGKDQVAQAKRLLLEHKTLNPQTSIMECPWWVLDRDDMKKGVKGICLPGELYHKYYVEIDKEKSMIWPDLFILAKNGWQIPVYNGHVPNVGIKAPTWTPPFRVYNGGHGSIDTLPIVAAISVPNGRRGINPKPIRIADLGATAASLMGLSLRSTVIGSDLTRDLL